MDEVIEIPDLEEIKDLGTAKLLLKYISQAADQQARTNQQLLETIEALRHEISELKRALFGQKSERVPDLKRDLNASQKKKETPEERAKRLERSKEKREKTRQSRRDETPTEIVEHAIVETECAQCGGSLEAADDLSPEVSEEYEYVPARVIRREHHRERKVCKCGCFAIAAAPDRLVEGGLYGPGLHAHVVIAKCADSLPLDRQARAFSRAHVPLSKSTLCDLFHRSAEVLSPLSQRILELIASSSHVNADETSLKVQATGECRRAFVWDFIATHENHTMVAYRFSADRSGQTPIKVLGDSTGVLQVDGFTGYNQVTTPDKRERAGCWAHARRKYFGALESAPDEAQWAIDKIREIYEVEYLAAEKKVLGKPQHLTLRKAKSKELVEELMTWADEQKPKHRPKSPLGAALTYTLNQRKSLERFLTDPKIRLDNNIAEQYLRLIALGRKNFLFVGHDEAGKNLATLQTLVSTCLANKVNPQTYLTDVLLRIGSHPHQKIDDLLPWNWHPDS